MTLARRAIRPPPEMPIPIRAMASGRPAATSEPKAITSTIAAARKAMNSSLPPSWARTIGSPPSSIRRPSPLLSSAASTSVSPSSFGTSQPGTVSGSVVVAIVPSSETRIASRLSMFSTFSASSKKAFTFCLAAGLIAPEGSSQTT